MDTTNLSSIVSRFNGDTLYSLRSDLLKTEKAKSKRKTKHPWKACDDPASSRDGSKRVDLDTEKSIELEEFVLAVSRRLQETESVPSHFGSLSYNARLKDLCHLFDLIDIDHSRSIHWDEFTNFIVALGPSNDSTEQRNDQLPSSINYAQRTDFADHTTKSMQVNYLLYMEQLDNLFVVESSRSSIKMYGSSCKLVHELQVGELLKVVLKKEAKWKKEKVQYADQGNSSAGPDFLGVPDTLDVLAVGGLGPRRRALAVSTSDQFHVSILSIWDVDKERLIWKQVTPVSLTGLEYESNLDMLVSWSSSKDDLNLYIWDIRNRCLRYKLAAVNWLEKGHTENISCAASVSYHKVLVTGGMEGNLVLWDITVSAAQTEPVIAGVLKGHRHGIRSLAYSSQHDLLFSAGFDIDCFAWDLGFKTVQMKLTGHRVGLIGVTVVKHETERAVTGDMEGVFRLWSIDRANGSRGTCLQTFNVQGSSGIAVRPTRFTSAWQGGKEFIIAGAKLFLFQTVRGSHIDAPIMYAGFSDYSGTFCVQRGADIIFVDGKNGQVVKIFSDMIGRSVTSFVTDKRQKKLLVGNNKGSVGLHNGWNIAQLRESNSHTSDVTCLHFCEEDCLVITAGLDGTLNIHEGVVHTGAATSLGAIPQLPLLRWCKHAHEKGIHLLTFSRNLGLIATASPSDPTIRLWDFQRISLDTVCKNHRGVGPTTLCFLDPHPLLAVGDHEGCIYFWATRPLEQNGTCLFMMKNLYTPPLGPEGSLPVLPFPTAVTALVFQSNEDGSKILFSGDDRGFVKAWNVQQVIRESAANPVNHPQELQGAYNPRQRHERGHALDGISGQKAAMINRLIGADRNSGIPTPIAASSTKGEPINSGELATSRDHTMRTPRIGTSLCQQGAVHFPGVSMLTELSTKKQLFKKRYSLHYLSQISVICSWHAHTDSISHIKHICFKDTLLTISLDMTTKIWSSKGALLGIVYSANENVTATSIQWSFAFTKSDLEKELESSVRKINSKNVRQSVKTGVERQVSYFNFINDFVKEFPKVPLSTTSRLNRFSDATESVFEDGFSEDILRQSTRASALEQLHTQSRCKLAVIESSPPLTQSELAQAILEDLDMGHPPAKQLLEDEIDDSHKNKLQVLTLESKVSYANYQAERSRGLRNAHLMDFYDTQLEKLGITGKGAEVRKKLTQEKAAYKDLNLRPVTAPASIGMETPIHSFEDGPLRLLVKSSTVGGLPSSPGEPGFSKRLNDSNSPFPSPDGHSFDLFKSATEGHLPVALTSPLKSPHEPHSPFFRKNSVLSSRLLEPTASQQMFSRADSGLPQCNEKKMRAEKIEKLIHLIERASKEPLRHNSSKESFDFNRTESNHFSEAQIKEKMNKTLKKYQKTVSQEDAGSESQHGSLKTRGKKTLHTSKKNPAKSSKRPPKERQDLSMLLQQDVEHQEEKLGLTQQGSHGRYGPYSAKDVLEFKTFFDFFAKEGSNIIQLDGNPAFLSNPSAGQILSSFKGKLLTKGKSELSMDEFMEIVFSFAKYEERRRMVHLIDVYNLAAKIKEDFTKSYIEDGGFLSKEVHHEIELHFKACERDDCGTMTVRELYEVLIHHKVLPPKLTYNNFDEIAKQVVYEGNKKALGNKEWEIFWRQVENEDIQQKGLSFLETMQILKKLRKLFTFVKETRGKRSSIAAAKNSK